MQAVKKCLCERRPIPLPPQASPHQELLASRLHTPAFSDTAGFARVPARRCGRWPAHLKLAVHGQEIKEIVGEGQRDRPLVQPCSGRSTQDPFRVAGCYSAWSDSTQQSAQRTALFDSVLISAGARLHASWTWASLRAVHCEAKATTLIRKWQGACMACGSTT